MFNCKNGCGYTNKHRGGMNLHEKFHCKKKKSETTDSNKGGARGGGGADRRAAGGCEHEYRLLTAAELSFLASKGATNFKEGCVKCLDLR